MTAHGFNFQTTYTQLPDYFFSELKPEVVSAPEVVIINHSLAHALGLNLLEATTEEQAAIFSGNQLPDGATPFAQAYAGHQFGHFTMLGDGRAIIWGEHVTPENERVDIQFKGSGQTPYSRRGDGRAVLSAMLREYLISEAMHALEIPTTRSLAVVTTGEKVQRNTAEPGAILSRVAQSHIRVGTFEFAAAEKGKDGILELLDYTINRHYPKLADSDNKAIALLDKVIEKQAELVVHWMRVGFIHGVMNTDNMLLSGETIDYGPCAFMDTFSLDTVFSSIDEAGRYAYGNQPNIVQWNLARFAEALLPVIDPDQDVAISLAEKSLQRFSNIYHNKWLHMMYSKLGLIEVQEGDENLIIRLLDWMQKHRADYTNTFYQLSLGIKLEGEIYNHSDFLSWYQDWSRRLESNPGSKEAAFALMKKTNPVVIPRNHKVEEALSAANSGNLTPFSNLLSALSAPYENKSDINMFQIPPMPGERVYQTFCGT